MVRSLMQIGSWRISTFLFGIGAPSASVVLMRREGWDAEMGWDEIR